jgi:cytochrome c553
LQASREAAKNQKHTAVRVIAKLLSRLLLIAVSGPTVISVPQASTKSTLDAAREDYLLLCAECHGSDAKGTASKNLSKIPPDLASGKQERTR